MPAFDAEQFRRQLAGLSRPAGGSDPGEYRAAAARLCVVLAIVYNVKVDRMEIWTYIAKAIKLACAQSGEHDFDRFWSIATGAVKADPTKVARLPEAKSLYDDLVGRDAHWRREFLHYLRTATSAWVIAGRVAWDKFKISAAAKRDERAALEYGEANANRDFSDIL